MRANGRSRFCSTALTSRDAWTKEPMDIKCYVSRGKAAWGDVWDDFLIVEKHPFPHIGARDGFQRWGCLCSSFTPGDWAQLGQCGTPSPLTRLHPIVGPPRVWTQAGPPSVFVTHCSPLYCDRPRFTMAALRHLVLQRLPPVSEEGSFTKLGSMICPFVVGISCSASCDVTD